MKSLIFLILAIAITNTSPWGGHNLTLEEAEVILGEPGIQLEKKSTAEHGGHQFRTRFMAQNNDKVILYYHFESYKDENAANATFDKFYKDNSAMSGFSDLSEPGDEAFFHTDNQNFSLIIARKGNEMIRLKVNKTTSRFSKENMLMVANKIIGRI